MTSRRIAIGDLTAEVDIIHGDETATASGRVFDQAARIVVSFTPQRYVGYCEAEIVSNVVWTMLFGRRINGVFYDTPDLDTALDLAGLNCTCADDEGDEPV